MWLIIIHRVTPLASCYCQYETLYHYVVMGVKEGTRVEKNTYKRACFYAFM